MTDSLFDPTGSKTERGAGNDFLGEQGANRSRLPDVLEATKTDPDAPTPASPVNVDPARAAEAGPFTADPDEAAERLEEMQEQRPTDVREEQGK